MENSKGVSFVESRPLTVTPVPIYRYAKVDVRMPHSSGPAVYHARGHKVKDNTWFQDGRSKRHSGWIVEWEENGRA